MLLSELFDGSAAKPGNQLEVLQKDLKNALTKEDKLEKCVGIKSKIYFISGSSKARAKTN